MSLAIPQKAKLKKRTTTKHFFYTVSKNLVQYIQVYAHLHQKSYDKSVAHL